jgi:hypothetical protein
MTKTDDFEEILIALKNSHEYSEKHSDAPNNGFHRGVYTACQDMLKTYRTLRPKLIAEARASVLKDGLKQEGWTCKEDSAWNNEIAEARASERKERTEKLNMQWKLAYDMCEERAIAQGKAHAEQEYTNGYNKGIESVTKTCEKCRKVQYDNGFEAGRIASGKECEKHQEAAYKSGQKAGPKDLIERLTSERTIEDVFGWQQKVLVAKIQNGHLTEANIKAIIKAAIKKASSISTEIGEKPPNKAAVSESAGVKHSVVPLGLDASNTTPAPENAKRKGGKR